MQKLATTYWMENNVNRKQATSCRVEWIKSRCEEYFFNGGREKYDRIERSIDTKISKDSTEVERCITSRNSSNAESQSIRRSDRSLEESQKRTLTLLDVGSCYNPFETLSTFDVTAIDLNGIPDKVLHCDFLNVEIGEERILSSDKQEILQLAENTYDVVVFSLFLEYLPCSKQRYICCKKAYSSLKSAGIFFIISPDSKHMNANARLIKSWRYVLSRLGFMRIKYEKLRHIHCMIFRKCVSKHVASRWATLQTLPEDDDPLYRDKTAIYIPQDFRKVVAGERKREKEDYDRKETILMFSELPFFGPCTN